MRIKLDENLSARLVELLVRLRAPGGNALYEAVARIAAELHDWRGCFVVLTDHKLRIKRP